MNVKEKTRKYVYQTWSRQADANPVEITRGEGSYYWDGDGKRWLDFASQVYNANLGHQHPRVIAAIKKQAETLCVAGPKAAYEAKALLGEKLAEITPGDLGKTFFCLSGAEANENAIKMARLVSGRSKVITRYRSYHGATTGALSYTGDPRRLPFEPAAPGVVRVQDPYCHRCPFGQRVESCGRECVSSIEDVIRFEGPESIAAILLEGFAGANGVLVPPPDYWPRIREICDRYGIILISDEVFTGLGRTGRWFAVDHWDVVPDIITMAKGLGAGHAPLGAVVTGRRIADYFEEHTLWCGLTSYAPPICVAAGLESLRVYEDEGVLANAAAMGETMMLRLRAMRDRHPVIGDVRGKGLLGVIELSEPRGARSADGRVTHPYERQAAEAPPLVPWNADAEAMKRLEPLLRKVAERGLYLHVRWNFIILAPPLNISETDLKLGLDIVEEGIEALERALLPRAEEVRHGSPA
jgi:taurine--2-oxoglutarate transaminase